MRRDPEDDDDPDTEEWPPPATEPVGEPIGTECQSWE